MDTVQVIYNVFDQSPEDELFFDEGVLTGRIGPETELEEGDFRNRYFREERKREVSERVRTIVSELGATEDDIAEIALRYVLSQPAVSTAIPGCARSVTSRETWPSGTVRASQRTRCACSKPTAGSATSTLEDRHASVEASWLLTCPRRCRGIFGQGRKASCSRRAGYENPLLLKTHA